MALHSTSQRRRFTKKNRLLNSAAYRQVFNAGRKGAVGAFKWFARANDLEDARLGVAVPKRCIPSAVGRNHVKRIIRESFRCNQEALAGWDIVVVVTRPLREVDIDRDLARIWARVWKY